LTAHVDIIAINIASHIQAEMTGKTQNETIHMAAVEYV
jgi:hypothetical protein